MIVTVFDTETTGLHRKGKPLADQPYVVQLAAIQFQDKKPIAHLSAIIKNPEVTEIDVRASGVHGFTPEIIGEIGVARGPIFSRFSQMVGMSDRLVAHNSTFDRGVMLAAAERDDLFVLTKHLQDIETVCTMNSAIPVVKKKGKYAGSYGWPKLVEAYKHFYDKEFSGAHDAMVDVKACAAVYFKLIDASARMVGGV